MSSNIFFLLHCNSHYNQSKAWVTLMVFISVYYHLMGNNNFRSEVLLSFCTQAVSLRPFSTIDKEENQSERRRSRRQLPLSLSPLRAWHIPHISSCGCVKQHDSFLQLPRCPSTCFRFSFVFFKCSETCCIMIFTEIFLCQNPESKKKEEWAGLQVRVSRVCVCVQSTMCTHHFV